MAALPGLCLAAVLLVAVRTDLAERRIPNVLILAGWSLALGWHLTGPAGDWTFDPDRPGAVGASGALIGLAALLLGFMPFYLLRIMGAGDVKLMSVVGAFFGASTDAWVQLPGVSLFVLAAGGLLACGRMASAGKTKAVLANLRRLLAGYATVGAGTASSKLDAKTGTADRMPYAVAIAAGTIIYVVTKCVGWMTVL